MTEEEFIKMILDAKIDDNYYKLVEKVDVNKVIELINKYHEYSLEVNDSILIINEILEYVVNNVKKGNIPNNIDSICIFTEKMYLLVILQSVLEYEKTQDEKNSGKIDA